MNNDQKKTIKAIVIAIAMIAIAMLAWYILVIKLPGMQTFKTKTEHSAAPKVVETIINFALP
jgi:hypothetical protein